MTIVWRTSSYCGNGSCVKVSTSAEGALVGDSKDDDGPVLAFGRVAWTAFLDGIRRDNFSRD